MKVPPAQPRRRYGFRLADVICPHLQQVGQQITGDLEVVGEVVFLSDRGGEPDRFAILAVEGIASPLIVPVESLRPPFGKRPEQTGEPVPGRRE